MINSSVPKSSASANTIQQTLGNMHTNRYYAPAETRYWPKIAGVASLSGGIVIPKSYDTHETDFFTQIDATANPPLIAFHGALDIVIPFYDDATQDVNLSSSTNPPNYKTENFCTINSSSFTQKAANGIELKGCSALNMYRVMKDLHQFSELYLDCSMAHGLDEDCGSCGAGTYQNPDKNGICKDCTPYGSDFGTGATNQQQTIKYVAARIAVFSHIIMYSAINSASLAFGTVGRSFFKDCENFRKCNQTTESNDCTDPGADTLCDGTPLFPSALTQ